MFETYTKQETRAVIKSIWRHLDKTCGCNLLWGWDWPTLKATHPKLAWILKQAIEAS